MSFLAGVGDFLSWVGGVILSGGDPKVTSSVNNLYNAGISLAFSRGHIQFSQKSYQGGQISANLLLAGVAPAGGEAAPLADLAAGDAGGAGRALWSTWSDYPKVTVGGGEYADINGTLTRSTLLSAWLPADSATWQEESLGGVSRRTSSRKC